MTQEIRDQFVTAAVEVLKHREDINERTTAIMVLGTLGTEDHIDLLLDLLKADDDRRVQHKVSQVLVRIGGERTIAGLQELMYAEDQYTRFLAAEALADLVERGDGVES